MHLHVWLHGYDEAGTETLLGRLPCPCRRRLFRPSLLPLSAGFIVQIMSEKSMIEENQNVGMRRLLGNLGVLDL